MKILKKYKDYIKEQSEEIENKKNDSLALNDILGKNTKMVKNWFSTNLFDASLSDISISRNTINTHKSLTFEFNNNIFYFQVILFIRLINGEQDGFLKIKKYPMDDPSQVLVWDSRDDGKFDVEKDFTAEYLIDKISNLEEDLTLGIEDEGDLQEEEPQEQEQNEEDIDF